MTEVWIGMERNQAGVGTLHAPRTVQVMHGSITLLWNFPYPHVVRCVDHCYPIITPPRTKLPRVVKPKYFYMLGFRKGKSNIVLVASTTNFPKRVVEASLDPNLAPKRKAQDCVSDCVTMRTISATLIIHKRLHNMYHSPHNSPT